MIASKNWTLNATAAARKKFGGGLTGQSTTSTPWKFDLVSRRNSTAPGSSIWEIDWYQNECPWPLFRGRLRSCQTLRYIRRWISLKPLEIEAWFQRTT